ncbi:MAG TPA: methyltransferase domain-containing protein [Candidatus Limnocylindrales bacterium]|nr:methyltransferase domain-containing protein [Candidatus Limnocylindrales bacterium]
MDARLKVNLDAWNQMARIHAASREYRLAEFKAGENVLKPIELREVGDVRGKSLLHMQCHFGLDTMSWARMGANITGVDFSDDAIALARSISAELKIPARFIQSNIYDAPDVLHEQFDIVFTSYGALCWLPDITRWAQIAAHFVKPGGFFYMAEFHPLILMSDNRRGMTKLENEISYFHTAMREDPPGPDYSDPSKIVSETHQWMYRLGDIVSALAATGLRIEYLHEFAECIYPHFPFMKLQSDGQWHIEGDPIPTIFSIKATKP